MTVTEDRLALEPTARDEFATDLHANDQTARSYIGLTRAPPAGDPDDVSSPIEEAIRDLQRGRIVALLDGDLEQGRGHLLMAAEFVTPEAVNFMAKEARGLICICLPQARCAELELPLLGRRGAASPRLFTVSIEARRGVTSGISAHDRAQTIRVAADPRSDASDLVRPGHVIPLSAREGGVLANPTRTEAAVDLVQLGGLQPAAVVCDILAGDGSAARFEELGPYGRRHGLRLITLDDIVRERLNPSGTRYSTMRQSA